MFVLWLPAQVEKNEKAGGDEDSPVLLLPLPRPVAIARPEDRREKSMDGSYRFYLGNLHAHSIYSGDLAKSLAARTKKKIQDARASGEGPPPELYEELTPAVILEKAKTNFYDFYAITDHSSPEQDPFYREGFTEEQWQMTGKQTKSATTADFLALRGYEFSRNNDPEKFGRGHMNVFGTAQWRSAYAPGNGFLWLYDWLQPQGPPRAFAQFNHPDMPGDIKAKNFNNFQGRTRERNEAVRLVEFWNGGDGQKYAAVVRKIWSLGWKVAPTANTDLHGLSGMENKRIRTGVLSEDLSETAILQSLHARRVFASVEPFLHLEFQLNGRMMGTAVAEKSNGEWGVKVFANDLSGGILSRVEIIGGRYEAGGGVHQTVLLIPIGEGKKIVEGKVPGEYDFYYACLFKEGIETMRAVSAPVWMDND